MQVGIWVPRYSDVIEIRRRNPRPRQTVLDCGRRKSRAIFDSSKSLLLGRGNELAVVYETRRRTGMICVDPKNVRGRQLSSCSLWSARERDGGPATLAGRASRQP